MLYEKKKLLIHRLIWFGLLLLGIIVPIVISKSSDSMSSLFLYITLMGSLYGNVFVILIFIASLFLTYKEYEYNGNEIIVYAGWYHHYIKVNGNILDEHNTLVTFTAIPLACTLDDGTDLEVTITTTNRISLKINNRLYTKRK